ncbi:MAG: HD domain-containing protein [Candidatus Kapaibacteriota bacterium]
MLINNSLLNEFFRGFHIQRWNDRIRPMDLIEIDKHSHKMLLAYIIGKYEEMNGHKVDWNKIIINGIFELLRRIVISDIKSPIYAAITKNDIVFAKLNEYIFNKLENYIDNDNLKLEFYNYLFKNNDIFDINDNILSAAHIYASLWEFKIIEQANPNNYQTDKIRIELNNRIEQFKDLTGINKLLNHHTIANFVDLFGYLRFQYRWAQIPRVPKTSVLGHSLFVAITSYFFARENNACPKRLYNAFFGGLFHDLPEAVTRDIISPVKSSSQELDNLIKSLESELAENEIYPLLEPSWVDEMRYFVVDEFDCKIYTENRKSIIGGTSELNSLYNQDKYNPYDGELIRAADHLAAFLEVWNSCKAGIKTEEMTVAAEKLKSMYKDKILGNVEFNELYNKFAGIC